MGLFLGAIIIVTVCMLGVAFFALWLMDKGAGAAFTDRFQDAEFILDNHRAPPSWGKRKSGFVWLMQDGGSIDLRKRKGTTEQGAGLDSKEKTRIMRRMDDLIEFFQTCPFFEDEETRELLLEELGQERADWETLNSAEIIGADEDKT